MLANSSVDSSHGVRSMNRKPSRRSCRTRVLAAFGLACAGRVATNRSRPSPNRAATTSAPTEGSVAPTTMPATAGPTDRWNTGRTTPSTPLAASSASAGRMRGRIAL